MSQDEILDEQDRIGIKPVEPTYVFPRSDYAKYGKRDLDKTEELVFKQQKMAGQVLVAIKNRCKQQVLDHADLILNAPGANPRTKLIAFVKFIEGRRLCDLTVVSFVQDDIKGLNPIANFPDAVDNIITINLLQEELTLMGQPYSDADLIIQHSNKMPNSDDFRALKMEFIDCDVSQFSTSRPTLTHCQPNPLFLRPRKTWDEYCHKVQRYNASEPQNQPQSALSARMEAPFVLPSAPSALAASSSLDLEATIRKILAESKPAITPKRNTASKRRTHSTKAGEQLKMADINPLPRNSNNTGSMCKLHNCRVNVLLEKMLANQIIDN